MFVGAKHDGSQYGIITQYGLLKMVRREERSISPSGRLRQRSTYFSEGFTSRAVLSKRYWIITNNLYAVMLRPLQKPDAPD